VPPSLPPPDIVTKSQLILFRFDQPPLQLHPHHQPHPWLCMVLQPELEGVEEISEIIEDPGNKEEE